MACHLAIVIPVLHHTGQCALKVTWRDPETLLEAQALKLWNGQDTVRVLASSPDDGALLLERLDAGRTLFDLPFEEAVVVAGRLVRNLAITRDNTLPTAASLAAEFRRFGTERWERVGRSIPRHHLDQAVEIAAALSADVTSTEVEARVLRPALDDLAAGDAEDIDPRPGYTRSGRLGPSNVPELV